ncbi:hypothetical protein [Bacillus sp. RO1]|uniref:Cap15 family cyclic dinucleotide receptor domain-containing protein n=1 Tax=Bacillus sp. RO1 TaxID=2722703 RepID=UPI001456AE2F|nr:hypothetical protein [Bacillus sp. RO1]NLP50249.1 hypothetical protein [Bacillus sp. RO1]
MYNKQLYNRILLFIAIGVFLIVWLIRGGQFNPSIVGNIFTAIGITLFIDQIIFKLIIWKLRPDMFYKWLTNCPYLGGQWEGTLLSNYVFPDTGEKGEPIEAKIEIVHDFDGISIRMETNKSYSNSYISGIIENEGKQKFLCYLYTNDADKDRDINPKHDGAVKLRIKHDGDLLLEGHYFTGRETTGKMEFRRTSKKNSHV